jgi:hypothetical protein
MQYRPAESTCATSTAAIAAGTAEIGDANMTSSEGHQTRRLQRAITVCGCINLLVLVALLPISYGLAVVYPFDPQPQPEKVALLQRLAAPFAAFGPDVADAMRRYFSGESALAQRWVSALAYGLPLLVCTAVSLIVTSLVSRGAAAVTESTVALLFKAAVGLAIASIFMYPMFTSDFWFYVAWGRIVAAGQNPYYDPLTPEALDQLPIPFAPSHDVRPTLGNLVEWACLYQRAADSPEFLAFKTFLAGCWVLSLGLPAPILADAAPANRALAMCLIGWLPISFHQTIAEGHNDVSMVVFILLWLNLVARCRHTLSPLVLAASVLFKYSSLPLIGLGVAHAWMHRLSWRCYLMAWSLRQCSRR